MALQGIINFNKPYDVYSARVVGQVKRLLPRKTKIGHAGTLDRYATGVLLLLVGKATRQCEMVMGQSKQYETTLKLGAYTASDDMETAEEPVEGAQPVTLEAIQTVIARYVGTIEQTPPIFSALHVGGRRSYELARAGEAVPLQPRPVRIDRVEVIDYTWPNLRLRIDCGRGTYIRALGRDIGRDLGVGAYLTQLERTRVGIYTVNNALSIEQLQKMGIEQALQDVTRIDEAGQASVVLPRDASAT